MVSSVVAMKVTLNAQQYVSEMQAIESSLNRMSFKQQQDAVNQETDLKKQARLRKQFATENEQYLKRKIRTENQALKLSARDNKLLKEKTELTGGLTSKLSAIASTAAGAAGAIYGTIKALSALKDIADRADKSQAKLNAIVAATGQAGNFNARRIDELSGSISKLTGFSKAQIKESSAMLLSFGLNDEELAKLMPRMVDVAAFMGSDMSQAAQQMGKAMNTGYGALSEIGVTMSDTQKKAFNLAKGMDKVNLLAEIMDQNVGGAAVALNSANFGVGNLTNEINELLLPLGRWVKSKVVFWLKEATKYVRAFRGGLQELQNVMGMGQLAKGQDEIEKTQRKLQSITRILTHLRKEGDGLNGRVLGGEFLGGIKIKDEAQAINVLLRQREGLLRKLGKVSEEMFGGSGDFAKGTAKGTNDGSLGGGILGGGAAKTDRMLQSLNAGLEEEDALLEKFHQQRVREEKQQQDALLAIKKEAAEKWTSIFSDQEKINKQNEDIRRSESKFWINFEIKEKQKQNAVLLDIERQRASEAKKIKDAEAAYNKRQIEDGLSLARGSAGVLLSVGEQLAIGLVTAQENSAEMAAIAVLQGIGQQLVGFGTQKVFEGAGMLITSGGTDPRGYGLMALGAAAGAAGIGMGATGAVLNASISGGSSASNSGTNEIGGIQSNSSIKNNSEYGSEQTIIINAGGSVYGDIRGVVNDFARASAKANRFNLGEI